MIRARSGRSAVWGLTLSIAATALLSGCGAGTDTGTNEATPPAAPAPAPSVPAPAPAPSPAPAPAPGSAVTYYFSDCQTGAAAGCVPGDNANPGTSPTAPKRTLASVDVNALAAGSRLLFARGGAWANFSLQLHNLNVTTAAPLVFDAYTPPAGGSARPVFNPGSSFFVFQTSFFGRTEDTGGYVLRNLTLDGRGSTGWGIHLRNRSHDILLDNLEITGFEIALHSQNESPIGNVTLRNSQIHHNSEMGMLGESENLIIEGTLFEANNFSGSGFNHAIYLGGSARNGIIRNNTFTNNSVCTRAPCADGNPTNPTVCRGGNVTIHGQWDGVLIEGNTIQQVASVGSCYGFSITPGYTSAEFFRNFVVRNNTVINLGGCAICAGASVGPVIENNLLINRNNSWMSGVVLGANVGSQGAGGDDVDNGAIVRNNTLCSTYFSGGSQIISAINAGTYTQTGNVLRTGADASTGPCAR